MESTAMASKFLQFSGTSAVKIAEISSSIIASQKTILLSTVEASTRQHMNDSILTITINPQTVRLGLLPSDLTETISINLGGTIFEVSSTLLTSNSIELRNIIEYNAFKCGPMTIDMSDVVSPAGFVKVLDLLNLRERIDMTLQEAFDVMKFVQYYDMVPLIMLLRTGLKARIEEHHVCRLIEFAKKFNIDGVMSQCQQYLKDRTRALLQSRQIEFDNEELLAQLMDRDLMIDPTEITESIIRWTKNNRGTTKGNTFE